MDGKWSSVTEKKPITVKGREIMVMMMTDTQIMLLNREVRRLEKMVGPEGQVSKENVRTVFEHTARLLDMLENRVVETDDREYLFNLMMAGELEIDEIMPIMSVFTDDAPAAPTKPKVTRGRPVKRR